MNSAKQPAALALLAEMFPDGPMERALESNDFRAGLAELAFENVFANLWLRPGLALLDRSLLTLGILIALQESSELVLHVPAALRNGLTREEIAEAIYHVSGYAGFPAPTEAMRVASEFLNAKGP